MTHDHAAHSHTVDAGADRGRLALALALIVAFMAWRWQSASIAHSLALLSDAGHMLTDAGAIGFSLLALRLAARPARGAMTFGFKRVEILSAQANGVTLLVLAAFILYEAMRRLFDPPHVHGWLMLAVALLGVAVNLAAASDARARQPRQPQHRGQLPAHPHRPVRLHRHRDRRCGDPGDGFQRADPIVSLLIAALMIRSGVALVKASGRMFLEAAPEGLDPQAIGRRWLAQEGVVEVHDLHVWEVTQRLSRALRARAGRRPSATVMRPVARWRPAARALRPRSHDPAGRSRARNRRLLEIAPAPGAVAAPAAYA